MTCPGNAAIQSDGKLAIAVAANGSIDAPSTTKT
jgi:hypothetical protein